MFWGFFLWERRTVQGRLQPHSTVAQHGVSGFRGGCPQWERWEETVALGGVFWMDRWGEFGRGEGGIFVLYLPLFLS